MPSFAPELEETLHNALAQAAERRHEYATLEHLLLALTDDEHASAVMDACGVSTEDLKGTVVQYLDSELDSLKVGEPIDPSPTSGFQRVVQRAILHVQSSGRDAVTGANVLVALFSEKESYAVYFLQQQDMSRLDAVSFISHGVAKNGSSDTTTPQGEEDKEAAKKGGKKETALQQFAGGPEQEGARRPHRSADRPRRRGRPHGPDPLPAVQEQPALCRRSRRRQDRHRRGAGAQDRGGRRARRAEAGRHLRARHGRAAGRHTLSRRLRGAAEAGHGRAGEAAPRGAVHRRDPHGDRCWRHQRRRHGRLQPAEAGLVGRPDSLHRVHHLQGVPVPLRKGSRAVAPVPEDRRERAVDRGHHRDPGRPALRLRGAPQGDLHARRHQGGGRAVGALHQRPQAARQGDRRGGRGRRHADACAALQAEVADRRGRDRGGGRHHGAHPAQVGVVRRQDRAPEPGQGPEARRVRAGPGDRHAGLRHEAEPGRLARSRQADRQLPVLRPDRRWQDGGGAAARRHHGHPAPAFRHERVYGAPLGQPPDRSSSRLCRLRPGRPADGRGGPRTRIPSCSWTRSRRRIPTCSISCCR